MNCIKKINLLLLLMAGTLCFAQNRKVELEITGAKTYKDLYIRAFIPSGKPISIAGETLNGSHWIFTIPDSVVEKSFYFVFRGQTPTENHIGFLDVVQGDTLIGREIHFEKDEQLIRLKAAYHHTTHEVNYQYIPDLKKTIALQEWDADYFFIDPTQNCYLKESMTKSIWGILQSGKKYDDKVNEMASRIKEKPTSTYYLTWLAMTPNYYTKQDISMLYYLFSDEMQRSYIGKKIYDEFSTFKISNVSLTNCDTKIEERIVADPDKYTLLIFSASWCAPCRKKIPMLKKIYKETIGQALNMVYITIDDEKMLPQWKKLIRKEHIPWRSLSLNNKELQDSWNIGAIPDYILIDPKWNARKINLNDENDINNLYSIIQNNNRTPLV
jgi:thiol-disulfide isomerase/thioredoxin